MASNMSIESELKVTTTPGYSSNNNERVAVLRRSVEREPYHIL